MLIPQELPRFKKDALLVVADTQTAKIYSLKENRLELINEIFYPEEMTSDKEGGYMRYGRGPGGREIQSHGNAEPVPNEDHLLKTHLIKSLNDDLATRLKNKEFEEWQLVAPDYIIKIITDKLHTDLKKTLKKTLAANLINQHPLDIIKRLI